MFVYHRCDVRNCVNPKHLFLGTLQENNRDMYKKGRYACGDTFPLSKLKQEDVRYIRRLVKDLGVTQQKLADRFGVARKTIDHIVHRRTWKHVK